MLEFGYTSSPRLHSMINGVFLANTSVDLVANQWITVAATRTAAKANAFYHNGQLVALGATNDTTTATANASGLIRLGNRTDAQAYIGGMSWAGVWSRALTVDEAFILHADPYCFLRPVLRRSYGFVGAALVPTDVYGTETLPIGFGTEATTVLSALAPSDTLPVGLSESLIINGTAAPSDTFGAGFSEAVTLLASVAPSETLPIGLAPETVDVFGALDGADTFAVVLAEAASYVDLFALTDVFAADILAVVLAAEVPTLLAAVVPADTTPVGLSEDRIGDATTDAADTLPAGLVESLIINGTADVADVFSVVLAEAATYVDLFAFTEVFAAETLAVALAAEPITLLAAVMPADALPLGVTEDVLGEGTAAPSETLGADLAESPLIDASLDGVDTLAVGLVEVGEIFDILVPLIEVLGADTFAVALADAAHPTIDFVALDTLPVGVSAETVVLLVTVTPADAAALGLSDANLIIAGTADAADTLPAGMTDTLLIVATIEPTDTLAVGADDLGYLTYLFDASDTLPVALADLGYQALGAEVIPAAGATGGMSWDRRQWRVAPFRATIKRRF